MSAGLKRIEWILPLATLLLLTCIGWGGYVAIRAAMRDALKSQLTANLNANVGTLRRWIEHEHELANVWASDPEFRSIVPHQLSLATNAASARDSLLTSTTLSKLRARLRPLWKSHDHEGFLIVNPRRMCVAAMDDAYVGQPAPVAAETAIDRALRGETAICQPFLLSERQAVMLVATPVRDQHEAIVAALVLMIDPAGEFTAIFANSRIGEAGESFAFDRQGRLLTASHFDQMFRQLGILPAGDETSILRVHAADPGGDLHQGFAPRQPASNWPLTILARKVLRNGSAIDVHGYRDYRGVLSVGAGVWLEDLNLGIITKIDSAEAFRPLTILDGVYALLFALVSLLSLGVVVAIMRERRRLDGEHLRQQRVNDAIRSSHLGLWEWNARSGELYLSASFKKSLGYDEDEWPDKAAVWETLIHPDDMPEVLHIIEQALKDGLPFVMEYRLRSKVHGYWWLRSQGQAIFDSGRQTSRMAGSIMNIMDVKTSELELRAYAEQLAGAIDLLTEAKREAEAANVAKSEFLTNMSHELRTPLTSILGFADLVLHDESAINFSPVQVQAMQTVLRNGQHLLDLINGILDLAKIESGKLEIEQLDCSPRLIASEVSELLSPLARDKGLHFVVAVGGDVPETILTDATRLRQILVNLCGNAVKFTANGHIELAMRTLEASNGHSYLEVRVRDTGIGMTAEQLARLFRPFSQADSSTSRRYGGSGLGLVISKRLAELLGGTLIASSEVEVGSTFVATIALRAARALDSTHHRAIAPIEAQSPAVTSSTTERFSGRILLAEDGPDNQRLISHLLTKAGAQVDVAENGQVACEMLAAAAERGEPYDLLISDMQMPVLDGYDTARRLRAEGHTLPIIALTAHAMQGEREKCLLAGCNEYASKPIDRCQLMSLVSHYLARAVDPLQPVQLQ